MCLQLSGRLSPCSTALVCLNEDHLAGAFAAPWLEMEASSEGLDRGRTSTAMTLCSGETEDTWTLVSKLYYTFKYFVTVGKHIFYHIHLLLHLKNDLWSNFSETVLCAVSWNDPQTSNTGKNMVLFSSEWTELWSKVMKKTWGQRFPSLDLPLTPWRTPSTCTKVTGSPKSLRVQWGAFKGT